MDFNDILSYPSPSDNDSARIRSSDLYACKRYLQACEKLVNVLSDWEIDIRSVHYKYRLERFLRSRSKTSRRFISTYEQRFPEFAIPKDQLFIYESNGNVKIDHSHPTTMSKNHPHTKRKPLFINSSDVFEENRSVPPSAKSPADKYLSGWTIAIYREPVLRLIEQQYQSTIPIPLPWIVKRAKNEAIVCDLRRLFQVREDVEIISTTCDPIHFRFTRYLNVLMYILGLCYSMIRLDPNGVEMSSNTSTLFIQYNSMCDERIETCWNLLLTLVSCCAFVTVIAAGILLSLLCYASIGVIIIIHHVTFGFLII